VDGKERDESNRARRMRLNARPILSDGLFPQEGHVQHFDEASGRSA
jgi:hypothetical protein